MKAMLRSSTFMDYLKLTKPGVTSLIVFTAIATLLIAPGHIGLVKALAVVGSIALGSGSSAAFNMWYERDLDALMSRTKGRPIPAGRIPPARALVFSIALGCSALVLMSCTNYMAMALLSFTMIFYCLAYTVFLKRYSSQNIVIGGLAGALPPVIAWAAATGELSLVAASYSLIIFLWTPPHFWALAIYLSSDYRNSNLPMLPVTREVGYTYKMILCYVILTIIASFLPVWLGQAGSVYLVAAACLNIAFLAKTLVLYYRKSHQQSRQLFVFSIQYLFLLFAAAVLDCYL